jgi:hypothetical protein
MNSREFWGFIFGAQHQQSSQKLKTAYHNTPGNVFERGGSYPPPPMGADIEANHCVLSSNCSSRNRTKTRRPRRGWVCIVVHSHHWNSFLCSWRSSFSSPRVKIWNLMTPSPVLQTDMWAPQTLGPICQQAVRLRIWIADEACASLDLQLRSVCLTRSSGNQCVSLHGIKYTQALFV